MDANLQKLNAARRNTNVLNQHDEKEKLELNNIKLLLHPMFEERDERKIEAW